MKECAVHVRVSCEFSNRVSWGEHPVLTYLSAREIMENIEIEIKVRVQNDKPLLDLLEKNGSFHSEKHQVDEYFSPVHKDFLSDRPVKEWLRLRDADGTYSINYKNWHYDEGGKSHYCDEYETNVEDAGKMKKILDALNYRSIAIVDKVRKIWMYKDYEIGIDSVKNLGNFVEIEYVGKEEKVDPTKITTEMVNFLKEVGCGTIERNFVGYPFQILFGNEVELEIQ